MSTETTVQDGKQVAKADRKTTEYVVLQQVDGIDWRVIEHANDEPHFTAVSATDAMKQAAVLRERSGTSNDLRLVAVPARSWKPMSRKVEQVTKEAWTTG